jgi:DEAD/DEAH box helicase domain-containing protein
VAGISTTRHPQLRGPAIFFYDAHPGGVGLVSSVFERMDALLGATLERVRSCACESGCPACVHSPRCGNGNRPIDKAAALRALELLLGLAPWPEPSAARPVAQALAEPAPRTAATPTSLPLEPRIVLFDLETQRSAAEVGGWHNAHLMRLALAVAYDTREERFETYREGDIGALLAKLESADLVVGFNVLRFDYRVLRGYSDRDLRALPTFDLLDAIHERLGFRVSLGHLGEETLGMAKHADGLQALAWWREGRLDEIERYCRQDVALLRDLFDHARRHGHLLFRTRRGERVRVPVYVSLQELLARGGHPPEAPRA